ncbi:MAG: hypothetical protein ACI8RD_009425, partial [Bacillariaceae sp.]
ITSYIYDIPYPCSVVQISEENTFDGKMIHSPCY